MPRRGAVNMGSSGRAAPNARGWTSSWPMQRAEPVRALFLAQLPLPPLHTVRSMEVFIDAFVSPPRCTSASCTALPPCLEEKQPEPRCPCSLCMRPRMRSLRVVMRAILLDDIIRKRSHNNKPPGRPVCNALFSGFLFAIRPR